MHTFNDVLKAGTFFLTLPYAYVRRCTSGWYVLLLLLFFTLSYAYIQWCT